TRGMKGPFYRFSHHPSPRPPPRSGEGEKDRGRSPSPLRGGGWGEGLADALSVWSQVADGFRRQTADRPARDFQDHAAKRQLQQSARDVAIMTLCCHNPSDEAQALAPDGFQRLDVPREQPAELIIEMAEQPARDVVTIEGAPC